MELSQSNRPLLATQTPKELPAPRKQRNQELFTKLQDSLTLTRKLRVRPHGMQPS